LLIGHDGTSKKSVHVAPKDVEPLNYAGLLCEVRTLFGLWPATNVWLSFDKSGADKLSSKTDLVSLDNKQLFVHRR